MRHDLSQCPANLHRLSTGGQKGPVRSRAGSKNSAAGDRPPAAGIDLAEAQRFLDLLDPGAGSVHFRLIPEAPGARGAARNIVGSLDEVAGELIEANKAGCGVFVSTQAMKGARGTLANVDRLRCCWLDIDGRAGQELPKRWLRSNKRGLCPPQIIVETSPGSFHAWWLLSDAPDLATWQGIQRRLLKETKADPTGNTDLAKVLRLPGFLHQKGAPHLVRMLVANRGRYAVEHMARVYTPVAAPAKSKGTANTDTRLKTATRADLLAVRSALKHLAAVPHPAVKRLPVQHGGGRSESFADDYGSWWSFGLAMYRAFGEAGFDDWHAWSQSSAAYPSESECRQKWSTFATAGHEGVSLGTIFHHAQKHGWRRPYVPIRLSTSTTKPQAA